MALASEPIAAQTPTTFRHLSIAEGLSQGAVSAIVQDRRGFMWFGTKDGLNRYDGHRFVVFRHDPTDSTSLSAGEVTALFEDPRGELWVGTRGGGVNRFDRARERFERVAGGPQRDVLAIAGDASGDVWVAAGNEGLYRLRASARGSRDVVRYRHHPDDVSSLAAGSVRTVLVDRRGELWVGTDSALSRGRPTRSDALAFNHLIVGPEAARGLIDRPVTALHEDAAGRLWIGSTPGVSALDTSRTRIRHYYHRYRTYRYTWGEAIDMVDDRNGTLWLSTRSELMKLDPASGTFTYLRHDPQDPQSINSNLPTALHRDRSDLLWVGTNGQGINVHDPKATRFRSVRRPTSWQSRLATFSVYTLFEDRSGTLWVDAGLLYRWNRMTGALSSFETTSSRPNDFGNTGVWSVIENSPGVLLAATYQGLHRYEIATGRAQLYGFDPADTSGLPEHGAYDVFRDRDGGIWVVTENYLARLVDAQRGRFERWRHKPIPTSGYWIFPSMVQDSSGALWFGSDQGITRFDPDTKAFRRYTHDPHDPGSLSSDAVRAILLDPRNPARYLWVGTAGGGLSRLDVETETFETFTERDGLPNSVVYAVLADTSGTLWLSTNKGLSRFDPVARQFRNFDVNDGLQGNEFNSGAAFRSSRGELFFGGTEGFTYFHPDSVVDNPHVPSVAITAFRRGNRYEAVGDSGSVLPVAISEADTLRLSYRDAVLTFEFAALEFSAPAKNRYAYRLRGFNDDWFEAGGVRAATYTNLPPGRYTLEVRASNNDGVWNEQGTSLALVITPPWWRTRWAYGLYAILALLALTTARRYEVSRLRLANRLEREHLETEQLRRIDRARSQLFANVSHEFRTPLTLTIGPLEDLRSGIHGPLSSSAVEQVDLARRNAGRVLDLVNEILELARTEAGQVTPRAKRLDLSAFVRGIAQSYLPLAERKSITFDVVCGGAPLLITADPDLLERAVSNVLTNAFKFTPEGGSVRVAVTSDEHTARISVRDNGPGIPAAELGRVFDRYHRGETTANTHPGTGIGLALARELLLLHGGSIAAESEEGFGSLFMMTLPLRDSPLVAEGHSVIDSTTRRRVDQPDESSSAGSATATDSSAPDDQEQTEDIPTVLVVDDNAEIRRYVAGHLRPIYRVLEAADGQQGLQQARDRLPDLVLSDVMMPVMDGYELCRALKSHPDTDFIPVILLTARAESGDRLAGLAEQADDYLTKPFEVRELLARIGNTIAMRRRLRERFRTAAELGGPASWPSSSASASSPAAEIPAADQRFLTQVDDAIEANLADEAFTVEQLAHLVAHSRGHLHRRLRELVDQTPSDLIRRRRLERAASLLMADAGSVADVAYAVGFKSVSHFSNAFHAFHGVRPSTWRTQAHVRDDVT